MGGAVIYPLGTWLLSLWESGETPIAPRGKPAGVRLREGPGRVVCAK